MKFTREYVKQYSDLHFLITEITLVGVDSKHIIEEVHLDTEDDQDRSGSQW